MRSNPDVYVIPDLFGDLFPLGYPVEPGMTRAVEPGMTRAVEPGMTRAVEPGMTGGLYVIPDLLGDLFPLRYPVKPGMTGGQAGYDEVNCVGKRYLYNRTG